MRKRIRTHTDTKLRVSSSPKSHIFNMGLGFYQKKIVVLPQKKKKFIWGKTPFFWGKTLFLLGYKWNFFGV